MGKNKWKYVSAEWMPWQRHEQLIFVIHLLNEIVSEEPSAQRLICFKLPLVVFFKPVYSALSNSPHRWILNQWILESNINNRWGWLCILLSSESVDKLRLSVWSNLRLGVLNGMSDMTEAWITAYCVTTSIKIWLNKLKGVWHFDFDLVYCLTFNEQGHEKYWITAMMLFIYWLK